MAFFPAAVVVVLISTFLQPANGDEQQPLAPHNYIRRKRHMEATSPTIEFYHEEPTADGGDSGIRQSKISSYSSYFGQQAADSTTGVSHFRHINAPNLITFVFSNGRHESSGINSYATADFNKIDPFNGVTERLIVTEIGGGAYTWVSTSTFTQRNSINGIIKHHVLFSGGNDRDKTIFPSVMYSFQENSDGSLQAPVWEWEAKPELPARFGALMDLGNIPWSNPAGDRIASNLASRAGNFDIIIAGYGGLDIYSLQNDGSYLRSRSLPVIGQTAATFVGIDLYKPSGSSGTLDQALLVVMNRSEWRLPGTVFNAPCFFYDYRLNQHFNYFAQEGQTVSVAVIDDHSHMLIGAGGNAVMEGQPNLMHKITADIASKTLSSVLVDTEYQLVPGVPTTYDVMRVDFVNNKPTPEDEFATVAFSGITKTRQVVPFRLPGSTKDYIVEVNEGQPTFVYCRNENGQTFRIIPLPGTQGEQGIKGNGDNVARAADVIVYNNSVYIIIAMFFTENIVYTVDMALLREAALDTPLPTFNPTTATPTRSPTRSPTESPTDMPTTRKPTESPTERPTTFISSISPGVESPTINPQPQQKDAPLAPKCGSVASSSGYGGVGAEAKGCTRANRHYGPRKKPIRGSTGVWP